MRKASGFTLLEVLVALAITAVGIAAVVKVTHGNVVVNQEVEDRFAAMLVASNQLTTLKLSRTWPAAGTQESNVLMGGRTWHLSQQIATTSDVDILRVDIEVFRDEERNAKVGSLFGYVARYQPPVPTTGDDNQGSSDDGLGQEQETTEDEAEDP